jgi:hypothetical protein
METTTTTTDPLRRLKRSDNGSEALRAASRLLAVALPSVSAPMNSLRP